MSTITAFEKLLDQAYENGKRDGAYHAQSIGLGESSYGATQSALVAFEFTSFLELRNFIRDQRWYRGGDNPGQAYMGTCEVVHIHHNDYSKVALLKRATHYDI